MATIPGWLSDAFSEKEWGDMRRDFEAARIVGLRYIGKDRDGRGVWVAGVLAVTDHTAEMGRPQCEVIDTARRPHWFNTTGEGAVEALGMGWAIGDDDGE